MHAMNLTFRSYYLELASINGNCSFFLFSNISFFFHPLKKMVYVFNKSSSTQLSHLFSSNFAQVQYLCIILSDRFYIGMTE